MRSALDVSKPRYSVLTRHAMQMTSSGTIPDQEYSNETGSGNGQFGVCE